MWKLDLKDRPPGLHQLKVWVLVLVCCSSQPTDIAWVAPPQPEHLQHERFAPFMASLAPET